MLYAYTQISGRLARIAPDMPLSEAVWIDLYRPAPDEIEQLADLGVTVPTIEQMAEIEISSRLYRDDEMDYMTVMLPGTNAAGDAVLGPVTFIVGPDRLVTVRHHAPRPFDTFPEQAGRGTLGAQGVEAAFLGLADEIIARFADILEAIGAALDALSATVFSDATDQDEATLRAALQTIGRQGERVGRVRLGLLSMERALSFFSQSAGERASGQKLLDTINALQRDISALGEHAGFVYARISLVDDATLGMISLAQNATVRIFSVVAVLFLPPTLVASIYGMNFRAMPELELGFGYPLALGLMVASGALTYLFFKWKKWL